MNPRPPDPQYTDKQLQGKAIARARLEAMQRRARRIRRYVSGTACALFVAAFLGVYVQLASGNDPALLAASKHTGTSTTALTASTTTSSAAKTAAAKVSAGQSSSTEAESSTSESKASNSGEEEASTESLSSVTTSQS